ncbi:Uncharacterized protein FWK35_00019426 [Aphis craccivora]|uniref:Uncharacterized protein n=1 Tax=Aphis craccivora TaxID=307492 RepID=A0A6G0Y625_APHCR|nr:Uncharacterized protein FWK35_00019426 [Aphis craccivora]
MAHEHARTRFRPLRSKFHQASRKYGIRMADGHIAITSSTSTFEARIGALEIKFEATILENLYCDAYN